MNKTFAVVVTYNRKHTLKECLRTILNGEVVPDRVLVVDNASTDGTPEFVSETFPHPVSVLRLPQNRGGAGGFKAGLTEALKSGCDLIWVMDDDHEVEPDTLRLLIEGLNETGCDVVGPAILSTARDGQLAWEIGPEGNKTRVYSEMVAQHGRNRFFTKIPDAFNAALYRRRIFEQLGLPDDRLFIRGDEVEYSLRMEKHGTRAAVVVAAKVYHPAAPLDTCSIVALGNLRLTAYYTGNPLKDYCIFRNRAFYFKKYGRYKSLLLDPPRYILFFLMTRKLDLKGLRLWLRGYIDGLFANFGYERQLLGQKS